MDIVIVENSDFARCRLASLLDGEKDYRVVASMGSAEAAVGYMSRFSPDLAIVGVPGLAGERAIKAIRHASPATEILIFACSDEEKIVSALRAGATGHLPQDAPPRQIFAAIEDIRDGGSPLSPAVARKMLRELQQPGEEEQSPLSPPLVSRRGIQILELLYQGYSFSDIADKLCISPHTVHTHLKKIYVKLRVNSRSRAIYEALRQNLLTCRP